MSGVLPAWTIYDSPTDRPGKFVARRFEIGTGPEPVATNDIMISDDIEVLRKHMMLLGLTCINRSPKDDPVVVETWL